MVYFQYKKGDKMKYTISRENNKYKKHFKWHLLGIAENGSKHSEWYTTQKEALYGYLKFENLDPNKYKKR